VVAVIVALVVIGQAKEVRLQRNRAEEKGAEALREGARAAMMRGDLLETRAKLRGSLESQDSALARVLWLQLQENPQIGAVELGIFIKKLALSPDGRTVAAAGSNKLVYLVDVQTQAVRHLRGHTETVLPAAFSPDGEHLASGTYEGAVGLWNLERDTLTILSGHTRTAAGKVTSVAFSPDGKLLASASYDKTIRLWDVETGAEKLVLDTGNRGGTVTFDPEGRMLASTGDDSLIRIWDVASAAEKRRLEGHTATTSAVAFSRDGRMIASTSYDRTVRLWDAKSGEQVRELGGLTDIGTGVAFSPDGKLVAAGSYDRIVRVWDTATGGQVKSITGHRDIVTDVVFGPEGRELYSAGADKTIRIWNLRAGEPRAVRGGHTDRAMGVAFSPDGELLASTGTGKSVRLWDVASGALLKVMLGHEAIVGCVRFSPDGKLLASGSIDGTVRIWDTATGNEVDVLGQQETGVYDLAFSPDGNILASGCNDNTVRLWDVGTGTQLRKLDGHAHKPCSLAFSPDGRFLASGSRDKTVRIWDGFTGEPVQVLTGHEHWACPVRFDPKSKRLASASTDETVRIWGVDSWRSKLAGRLGGDPYAIWLAEDRLAATVEDAKNDRVLLWNGATGDSIPIDLTATSMLRAAYSPDGTRVATSTDEGNVILWDAATGRRVWRSPLLKRDPPAVLTHLGWQGLGASSAGDLAPEARWRDAVETRVSIASQSDDGAILCALTHAGEIELWNLQRDERLFADRVEGLVQVVALPDGCLARTATGEVRHYRSSGSHRVLFDRAGAVSYQSPRQEILVASDREVRTFDGSGKETAIREVGRGITALTRVGDMLVLGFQEGNIQLLALEQQAADAAPQGVDFNFEGVPSSTVRRLLAGPMDTLVASYDSGFLGIWSLTTGTLLYHFRLHGPVEHLLLDDNVLYAATRLGDHHKLDLGVLDRGYCDLMREVWQAVPVIWSEGRAAAQAPPDDHECMSP
jgi:WD40 repeat protein